MGTRFSSAAFFAVLALLVVIDHVAAPGAAPVGGLRWICPAYGVLAGIAFVTANPYGLATTLLSAHLAGCL